MVDKFAAEICRKLRSEMNDLADHLASNNVQTLDDYRYVCGVIRGLARAEEYTKDLAKAVEEAE